LADSPQFEYLTYGTRTDSEQIGHLLDHLLDHFLTTRAADRPPTPLCIWGTHGIGKTELVRASAERRGCRFVYIAPAQFEEMGDLVGMPRVETDPEKGPVTHFAPPDWVPHAPGPGILLIDDVNRADDRILRGIMQLLQNYELVSWHLPPGWLIVLTANPDGGDYSVTTMDDAMLTRMMHVTLAFEPNAWARWAERSGVDPRGIAFVLTYPELLNGRRTTPRSLVQFFGLIQPLADLRSRLELVKLLADGCLDPETTAAFLHYVNVDLDRLVTPEEILDTDDFDAVQRRLDSLVEGKTKRLDILSVTITRLVNHLTLGPGDLTDRQFANLRRFVLLPLLPNDLRLSMAQDLVKSDKKNLKKLYAVPEVGRLLLTKM
jgi:hypothetical protein